MSGSSGGAIITSPGRGATDRRRRRQCSAAVRPCCAPPRTNRDPAGAHVNQWERSARAKGRKEGIERRDRHRPTDRRSPRTASPLVDLERTLVRQRRRQHQHRNVTQSPIQPKRKRKKAASYEQYVQSFRQRRRRYHRSTQSERGEKSRVLSARFTVALCYLRAS